MLLPKLASSMFETSFPCFGDELSCLRGAPASCTVYGAVYTLDLFSSQSSSHPRSLHRVWTRPLLSLEASQSQ